MEINWQKEIHSGWRQGLGLFLIIGGITLAVFYYSEVNATAKYIANPKVKLPSPSVLSSSASAKPSTSPDSSTMSQVKGKMNISTATQTELEGLPGIGPSKAKAIIDYRAAHPFKSVNDLDKVKGIGSKTLQSLKPLVEL